MMKLLQLILLFSTVWLSACKQGPQPQHISYINPYNLENIDYVMDVRKFMLGTGINESVIAVTADTLAIFDELEKSLGAYRKGSNQRPWGIEYYQSMWEEDLILATYGSLSFYRLRMITDLDNRPLAICASGEDMDVKPIDETISTCDERFGESVITSDHFINPFYIYTWENDNETIKLVTNRFCIKCDKDGDYQDSGENGNVSKDFNSRTGENYVYLFIIKKEHVPNIVGKFSSGDFLFCKQGDEITKTTLISSN